MPLIRHAPVGSCRSCGASILWAKSERDHWMPLDLEPYDGDEPRGLFLLRDGDGGAPVAYGVTRAAFEDEPLFRSHFATCPNADAHRRSR